MKQATDTEREEEQYREPTNRDIRIYDHKDIGILGVTGNIAHGFTVQVKFKNEFEPDITGELRPRVMDYPLEQAEATFQDVLARHVALHGERWYPRDRFPPLIKYYNYDRDAYPRPKAHQRYEARRNTNVIRRYVDRSKMFAKRQCQNQYELGFMDSGSDTFGIGGTSWIIDTVSDRTVEIAGHLPLLARYQERITRSARPYCGEEPVGGVPPHSRS